MNNAIPSLYDLCVIVIVDAIPELKHISLIKVPSIFLADIKFVWENKLLLCHEILPESSDGEE